MQIKFIISNHSIRETTLCAAQTYGATSGGQQCLQETAEVGATAGSLFVEAGGGLMARLPPPLCSAGSLQSSPGAGPRLTSLRRLCPRTQVSACVPSAGRKCVDRHGCGRLLTIERFLTKINLCRLLDN